MIQRILQQQIEKYFFKGKAIIVYGARQVGKTTLLKSILKKYPDSIYYNCDEPDVKLLFENKTSTELLALFRKKKIMMVDEAQRVENIGITLKLIVDNYKDVQIIVTGSSSFDVANKIKEPMTGRKYEFNLYPFSFYELAGEYSPIELNRSLEQRLIFGSYPEIVSDFDERVLKDITESYLYKDILLLENIRNSAKLKKLLQALALQIGNEVSYNELAQFVDLDKNTVSRYIDVLERAFIIFRLIPLHRNKRNELQKLRKVYFYDTGVRNALINNMNPLNLRTDTGALWENFLIMERVKYNSHIGKTKNIYFWRTHDQEELDYIEDFGGKLYGYEFKYSAKKAKTPQEFLKCYSQSTVTIVNRDNYLSFIGVE